MRNKKLILVALIVLLVMFLAAGCGSSSNQSAAPAPAAPAKSAMPNEDPKPIAQDLERKLKDTGLKVQEGKWGEAKIIAAEMIKTNDRLIVHITDAKMKELLQKSVKEASDAVNISPANQKNAESKILVALEALKQANAQLQNHTH